MSIWLPGWASTVITLICRIRHPRSGTNVAVHGPDAAPAGPAGADGGLPRVGHTGFGLDADLRYFDLHRDAE